MPILFLHLKRLICLFSFMFALTAIPTVAKADFRVCNDTEKLVGVSVGYRAAEGWVSEGWWHIPGAACATVIDGDLQGRFYYIYAEDSEQGGRWDGPVNMCVAQNEYKIDGVKDCFSRGYQRLGFQEYDTGEQKSWTVQLSDSVTSPDTPRP